MKRILREFCRCTADATLPGQTRVKKKQLTKPSEAASHLIACSGVDC